MLAAPETLVTTYLHMTTRQQFKPSFIATVDNVRIEPMQTADVNFYRYLYRAVGEDWCWRDRLYMSDDELQNLLESDSTHVFVMYVGDAPAGYVELARKGSAVEIAYFGLRKEFHGRGLGKHLLSYGVDRAWELGADRVWLHTCNLDGPHALNNYQKRGFEVFRTEVEPMPARYS